MSAKTLDAAEKLRTALDLFGAGEDLMRQNLRRAHPEETAEEIERRLGRWLSERPGAEGGDTAGRLMTWPRPRR